MYVQKTVESFEDGVASFTCSIGDDDHRFEVWSDGGIAKVEYQETHTWRGNIEVSEPDEDIFKSLIVSEEMTDFLEEMDLDGVERASPQA